MESEQTTLSAGARRAPATRALAAQLLATLARVFGERIVSIRFVFLSLMISVGALAAAHIIEFMRVAAADHMLFKYGFVLGAALGALLLTPLRGVRAGLCVFVALSTLGCVLDPSRIRTYGLLLLLALPGLVLNAISLTASRWLLTRAARSARPVAWVMALVTAPAVCAWLYAAASSTAVTAAPRFSSFVSSLAFALAVACSLVISAVVIAVSAAEWLRVARHGSVSR